MRQHLVIALLVGVSACGSSVDRTELASLTFEAPVHWARTDTHGQGSVTAVFAPVDNARSKETITVIRTEIGAVATKYGTERLGQLLRGAQASLPNARLSKLIPISTASGLAGLRIDVDFVPSGLTQHYHRVHAVLADGSALVHVMWTAPAAEIELPSFQKVLDTLREES